MGSARAGRRASCRTHVMREGETISYFYNMRYYTAAASIVEEARRGETTRRYSTSSLHPR